MTAKIAVPEIHAFLGKAYSSVAELIGRSGLDFAGPPFARRRPLDNEFAEFEVEAGFPVRDAARLRRHRGLDHRPRRTAGGPAWECHYTDPDEEPNPSNWRTETVQPYASCREA